MLSSLADSTIKQYNAPLKTWWAFCEEKKIDPYKADERSLLVFLSKLFDEGSSYGTINTARSAINLISCHDLSDSPLVSRFFKGVFKLRPTTPKYSQTWDLDIVLRAIENKADSKELTLKELTVKTAMLLALTTGFRSQTLAAIKISMIKESSRGIELVIDDNTKTSRPGFNHQSAFLPFFEQRPKVCVARTVLNYIESTKKYRENTDYLLISYKSPFKKASSQTISRWLKSTLQECGIKNSFSGHSTRHASTSKAFAKGLDVNIIKKAAGWSPESRVFAKYYNRNIASLEENFATRILE